MYKTLYGKSEVATDEGRVLERKITEFVKPIIKEYSDNGYSIRDAEQIITDTVHIVALEVLLFRSFDEEEKEYNEEKN